MRLHKFKLRLRRRWRQRRSQAQAVSKQTERTVERYFFGRFEKFSKVGRFLSTWVLLMLLLIGCVVAQNSALSSYYQTLRPVPGGIYREGVLGTFTNANPMYATNDVDLAVSHLIFAGLFRYDTHNHLVGNLAKSWQVDKTGQVYTVRLRPHLTWQDGQPLTAADVVYTYRMIQDPDAQSPLRGNWEGIDVQAQGDRTIVFKLPNPLSSFIYNLTTGIVPKHLLAGVAPVDLRSAAFNTTNPVGAGPFMWSNINISGDNPANADEQIGLVPFNDFWAGPPKLKTFTLHAFARSKDMLAAYRGNQLTAMAGLTKLPPDIRQQASTKVYDFPLLAANMVFFRTTDGVLKHKEVRQALVEAADPTAILSKLNYGVMPVREPFLSSQFTYDAKYAQPTGKLDTAKQQLDKAGWYPAADGIRQKKHEQLAFTLTARDTPENRLVVNTLQRQWRALGVTVKPLFEDDDSFHTVLAQHGYDAILYGITIGVDPDVFVYWDSSQADVRSPNQLNLSEYQSSTADAALEGGRTRSGTALRRVKYQPFLKAWQADAPALALYQPRFLYVSHGPVYGLEERPLNTTVDRYDNVNDWMIRTANVTNHE